MQQSVPKEISSSEKIDMLSRELELMQKSLVEQFYADSLTRLPNLYKLRHDLEEQNEFTLILANIDNFKLLNDFYGFVVGDFILESFAKSLKESQKDGTVYRIAGDEFAILIKEKMNFYLLKEYIESLSKKLTHLKYAYAQTEIYVDCTLSSSASRSNHDIFSKVNMALKYAKQQQLKYWIYEDSMSFSQEYENNLKYASKIRKAIVDASGIVPYFQPIINNKTNEIVKFEALSRLIDEEGVIHDPNNFIPVAKTIKVYDKITMMIIEKSFKIFEEYLFDFSINLSFEDIINPEICDFIIEKLRTSNMGHRVTFEPDFIKIDGSLIKELDKDRNAQIVVETIVSFSKKLGIKTVAEFVHSSTVLSAVKQLGIDYSQGYYIDMPSPVFGS